MIPLKHLTILWKLRTLARHPVRTFKLFLDKETPLSSKLLPIFAILYTAFPLDFLPDIFPIIGWFDDATLLILLLSFALGRIPDAVYTRAGLDRTKLLSPTD